MNQGLDEYPGRIQTSQGEEKLIVTRVEENIKELRKSENISAGN
jgi:hypothetical protein